MFSHFLSNPGSSGVDDNLHYIKKVKSCFLDIQVSVWFSVWLFGYINIGTIRVFKGFGPVSVTGNSVPVRFFGSGFFLPSATVCVMASHVEVMAWAREAHVTAFFVQIWYVNVFLSLFSFQKWNCAIKKLDKCQTMTGDNSLYVNLRSCSIFIKTTDQIVICYRYLWSKSYRDQLTNLKI